MSTSFSSSSDALTDRSLDASFPDLHPSNMDLIVEEDLDAELSDIMLDYLNEQDGAVCAPISPAPIQSLPLKGFSLNRSSPPLDHVDKLSRMSVSPLPTERVASSKVRTLDPIHHTLVGQVRSRHLLNILRDNPLFAASLPAWARELSNIFNDQAPALGWCAFSGRPWDRSTKHICRPGYKRLIDSLSPSILDKCDKSLFFSAPGRVTIFTVPKDEDKLRLIANCVELNKLFGRPPRLLFATTAELFMIITFFKDSSSFFSTADFRHWFHQLALPKARRHFFSLLCSAQAYRFKSWLMGFSWSPFVAQAHSMAIAKVAIDRCKGLHATSPYPDADSLPPFWVVSRSVSDFCLLQRSDVVAFVVFWYDNLLIVADSLETRQRVQDAIASVALEVRAKWKVGTDIESVGFSYSNAAFLQSTNEVEYLGLRIVIDKGCAKWSHARKTIDRWLRVAHITNTTPLAKRSYLDAAALCGFIIRDWSIKEENRHGILPIIKVCQKLGSLNLSRLGYRKPATDLVSSDWTSLLEQIHTRFSGDQWHTITIRSPHQSRDREFLASDACDMAGAVVDLKSHSEIVFLRFPRTQWANKHITRKESIIAILGVEHIIKVTTRSDFTIIILVDNIAAASVINKGTCAFDAAIDEAICNLLEEAQRRRILVRAIYIPGDMQPADEPSRSLAIEGHKCDLAVIFAMNKLGSLFTKLFFEKPHRHHKRLRVDMNC